MKSINLPKPLKELKTIEFQTKCPCGHELKLQAKKPAYFKPEVTKSECAACGSKYLIKTKVGKNRQIDVDLGIQELSEKCKAILQGTIDEREKELKSNVKRGAFEPVEPPDGPKSA